MTVTQTTAAAPQPIGKAVYSTGDVLTFSSLKEFSERHCDLVEHICLGLDRPAPEMIEFVFSNRPSAAAAFG